jgi:glycosyltransferase involved in cell wall biosynthesis
MRTGCTACCGELTQRRLVRDLILREGVSLVHQPTPVSPKEPSLLYGLGVPVIIGPMNGGIDYPAGFVQQQAAIVGWLLRLGRVLSHTLNFLAPGKRQATALLVANERTRRALPHGAARHVIEIAENGVDLSVWQAPVAADRGNEPGPLRLVFLGRLVDWKAVDLLLEAFAAACQQAALSLTLIGDGPERHSLEDQADRLGRRSPDPHRPGGVFFAGWMAQTDAAQLMANQDCLVLPSLMECGGAVVLEAMSMSLPVIATDWGGPADYLDASCGILVAPHSRDGFVDGLAAAMLTLAGDPALRQSMGRAGRQKVERSFDWERKVDRMLEVYQAAGQVTVRSSPRRGES